MLELKKERNEREGEKGSFPSYNARDSIYQVPIITPGIWNASRQNFMTETQLQCISPSTFSLIPDHIQ